MQKIIVKQYLCLTHTTKDGKSSDYTLNLSNNLDYIFTKNKDELKNNYDLFIANFSLFQAYYDNNIENINNEDVYPFYKYYPDDIDNKLKNSSLDDFFQKFHGMICKNIENNEIFNCYKVNSFCWHLWNADNDFRIDLES